MPRKAMHRVSGPAPGTGSRTYEGSKSVFVVGCPRSGTSALSWAVAAHPDFWTSAESHLLFYMAKKTRFMDALHDLYQRTTEGPEFWLNKNEVSFDEFQAVFGLGIDRLFLSRSRGKRWVEASPEHTFVGEEIFRFMPNARIVHIIRDGRGVVHSMLNSGFDIQWAKNFSYACKTWVKYIEAGMDLTENHPRKVFKIIQRELLTRPGEVCRDMLRFLDAEHSDKPAEFLSTKRVNSSFGNVEKRDIRKPKDPGTLFEQPWSDWTRRRKNTFEKIAGQAMERAGIALEWE